MRLCLSACDLVYTNAWRHATDQSFIIVRRGRGGGVGGFRTDHTSFRGNRLRSSVANRVLASLKKIDCQWGGIFRMLWNLMGSDKLRTRNSNKKNCKQTKFWFTDSLRSVEQDIEQDNLIMGESEMLIWIRIRYLWCVEKSWGFCWN